MNYKWNEKCRLQTIFVFLTVAVYAVLMKKCFCWSYAAVDDIFMREFLSGSYTGTPDAHAIFVLYPLSFFIKCGYLVTTKLDWYGLTLTSVNFLCVFLVQYRLWNKGQSIKGKLFHLFAGYFIITAVGVEVLTRFTFTTVSAVTGGTAIFWYATAGKKNDGSEKFLDIIVLTGLLFFTYCLRSTLLLAVIAMLAIVFLFRLKSWKQLWEFSIWKTPVIALLCIILVYLCNNVAYSSVEWSNYQAFNTYRSEIQDYSGMPSYEENKNFYQELGLSEAERDSIQEYAYILPSHMKLDTWRILAEKGTETLEGRESRKMKLERVQKLLKSEMLFPVYTTIHRYIILFLFLLCMVLCITKQWKNVAYLFSGMFMWLLLWSYLAYQGRLPERVGISLHIIGFLFVAGIMYEVFPQLSRIWKRVLLTALSLGICFGMLQSVSLAKENGEKYYTRNLGYRNLAEYCRSHSENLYFFEVHSFTPYSDFFTIKAPGTYSNYMRLGDWMSYSPHYEKKLQKHGITDVLEAIMERDDVYIVSRADRTMGYVKSVLSNRFGSISWKIIDTFHTEEFDFYVYKFQKDTEEQYMLKSEDIEKVIGHENSQYSINAIDNDVMTKWNSHGQEPGTAFDIILKNSHKITGFQTDVLDYGDRARALRVFVSEDQTDWKEVNAITKNGIYYAVEPVACQYIRLLLGETGEEIHNDWSIRELNLFGTK